METGGRPEPFPPSEPSPVALFYRLTVHICPSNRHAAVRPAEPSTQIRNDKPMFRL